MDLNTHPRNCNSSDPRLAAFRMPLNLANWKLKLARHPDKDYVDYILKGIEQGFQIGIDENRVFRSAKQNMQSAMQNPLIIEEYLAKESTAGNILGLFRRNINLVNGGS